MNFIIGCNGSLGKSSNVEESNTTTFVETKDTIAVNSNSKKGLPDKTITITVSYAAIECGCPQWFETKFKDVKFLEGVERFYLEPINKGLVNANSLWDGEHLPLTLKIVGTFSKEKEVPITYRTKGDPEKARIFWYEKITVLSPVNK